ncbi:MAG: hypothetical protein JF615_05490 [Asticcacaulis sp.]|nr:hypothetical protein [Asticcacaulis sp.]
MPALIMSAALLAQDSAVIPVSGTAAAVTVDDYHRNYEAPKGNSEMQYDSRLQQALTAREGQMEGSWLVTGADGRKLINIELRTASGRLEGAWRSAQASYGLNGSGFVSDVSLTGRELEVNYFVGGSHAPIVLHLHKDSDGLWRGTEMNVNGERTPIVLTRTGA